MLRALMGEIPDDSYGLIRYQTAFMPGISKSACYGVKSVHNGHAWGLQACDAVSIGQVGGPDGHLTRDLTCVPPPHVCVHGDHWDHSVLNVQVFSKHGSTLSDEPRQPSAVEQVLVRFRLPWPHVLLLVTDAIGVVGLASPGPGRLTASARFGTVGPSAPISPSGAGYVRLAFVGFGTLPLENKRIIHHRDHRIPDMPHTPNTVSSWSACRLHRTSPNISTMASIATMWRTAAD
uniref:Uncharacterized protein n=1 Tax=Romanomermis culicivorax TaxID=13658 RepID=A0A915L414_ROMCU